MSLNDTPRASCLHIGIFGKRNSGKSSIVNAITGHNTALVSNYAGTTTDPVYKTMEIYPIGPCVLIDTAGFDDKGTIGQLRIDKTKETASKTDIAIVVFDGEHKSDIKYDIEKNWIDKFRQMKVPVIGVVNKSDVIEDINLINKEIETILGIKPIIVSAHTKEGIPKLITEITRKLPKDYDVATITGDIVKDEDVVLLVMTSDIQAPKGRLILPQVRTIRELLDRKCVVLSVTVDKIDKALAALVKPPDVIITDSQVFNKVYEKKPYESKLTSFSVLFAAYKGDIDYYIDSVKEIENLTRESRVLIAEACTHAPLEEDIGRVKIPKLLRNKIGEKLKVDVVSGNDFPQDLSQYDLIIHCGGCMFNRKYVLSRIDNAVRQNIPMTNYGIVIAYLLGILDKISLK